MGIDASSLNTLYTELNQQIGDYQKKGMSEDKALTKVLIRFTEVDGKQQIVVEKKSFWTTLKNIFIPGRKAEYNFEENINKIKNGFPTEVKDFVEYQKYSKLAKELNTIVHHVNETRGKDKEIKDFKIAYLSSITMTTEEERTVRSAKPVNPPVPQSTATSDPKPLQPETPVTEPVTDFAATTNAPLQRPAPGGKSADGKLTQVRKIAMEAQLFGLQKKEAQNPEQAPKTEEVVHQPLQTARRPKGPQKNVKVTRDEAQNLIAKNSAGASSENAGNLGRFLVDNDELFNKFLGFSVLENCESDATAQTIAEEFKSRGPDEIEAHFANALSPLLSDPNNAWLFGAWQGSSDYAKEGTLAHTLLNDMKTEVKAVLLEITANDQQVKGALNKLVALCQKANWLVETHGKSSDEITYVKATLFADTLYKAIAKEYMYNGKFKEGITIRMEMKDLIQNRKNVAQFFRMNPEVLQVEAVGDKNAPLPTALREIKIIATLASHTCSPEALLKEFGQLNLPAVAKE